LTEVYADLVYESTTTTGSGTITLAGAYTTAGPAQTFASGVGTGNTCCYCITSGSNWEVGHGTVGGSGPYTLSRTTVFASSNSNALITLSGTSLVSNVLPAAKIPFPFTYEGVWSGSSAYPAYSLALYNGDVYVSNTAIAAPTGSVAVSSPTTATPSSSTTWSLTYSTSGANRLIVLALQIPNESVTAGTITSVSSPNATWSVLVDHVQNGIGYTGYAAVWIGQAGAQLAAEPISVSLASACSGNVLAFDLAGLNLGGTIFDPNAALPYVTGGNGPSAITASYTTTNANDMLLALGLASNNNITSTPPSGFTYIGGVGSSGSSGIGAFYESVSTTQSGTTATIGSGYQAWQGIGIAVETPATPTNLDPSADTRWQHITAISTMFDELFGSSKGTLVTRGSSAWQGITPLTDGQLLIGNTSAGIPTKAQLSAGTNIAITNAPGSITVGSTAGGADTGLWATTIGTSPPTQSSTGFTNWLNQGTGTVANSQNGISVTAPATSGDQLRVLYQTAPSTPYSRKALIGLTCRPGNYQLVGFGWAAGSPPTTSTALQFIDLTFNGGLNNWTLSCDHWSNVTTSVGSDYHNYAMGNPTWVMIEDDGTNFYFKWSASGDDNDFVTFFSGTKSGGYLGSSGYQNIAFITNRNNNDGSGSTAVGTMFFYGS
jgi:hypothetical protein